MGSNSPDKTSKYCAHDVNTKTFHKAQKKKQFMNKPKIIIYI
jgi:hypothetical protein